MRELPATMQGMAGLIGALEALEHHCRWLCAEYPDVWHIDTIRFYLTAIDQLDTAGRFGTALPQTNKPVSPNEINDLTGA